MKSGVVAIGPVQVAASFVGAAIGAGFATGQEILQFFGYFGAQGLWGIGLSSILLGFFAYSVLELSRQTRAHSYREVMYHVAGGILGPGLDWLTTFFLFGGLVSMIAGSGALMREQFGWASFYGQALMAVASVATVLLGLEGVVGSMTFLVPLMFTGTIVLGAAAALATGYPVTSAVWRSPASAPIPWWPASAVIYASYNLLLTIAVLAPLGSALRSDDDSASGAVLGGAAIGLSAVAAYVAVSAYLPGAADYEVPMMFAAGQVYPLARTAYGLVIQMSIYTTAISALYGFVSRLAPSSGGLRTALVIVSPAAALVLASTGFTNVVRILYPAAGLAGLVLLASLTYSMARR